MRRITKRTLCLALILSSFALTCVLFKRGQKNDSCAFKDAIHIATVAIGENAGFQVLTMIKSITYHLGYYKSQSPGCLAMPIAQRPIAHYNKTNIGLHILTDAATKRQLHGEFSRWNITGVTILFHDIVHYLELAKTYKSLHHSGNPSFSKLWIQDILPCVDKVIVADSDMLFNEDIRGLWAHFERFNHKQMLGLVEEGQTLYWSDWGRVNSPKLSVSYNGGLVLLDLKKLRQTNWIKLWTEVTIAYKKRGGKLYTGDQDVFNLVVNMNLSILYVVPCEWNIGLHFYGEMPKCPCSWIRLIDQKGAEPLSNCEPSAYHFNMPSSKPESTFRKQGMKPVLLPDNFTLNAASLRHTIQALYSLYRTTAYECFTRN